jgi:hypothetical protein
MSVLSVSVEGRYKNECVRDSGIDIKIIIIMFIINRFLPNDTNLSIFLYTLLLTLTELTQPRFLLLPMRFFKTHPTLCQRYVSTNSFLGRPPFSPALR